MKGASSTLCFFILFLGVVLSAEAGVRETFEAANEAFWSGEYERAIQAYEEIIELGVWDKDVFYNLGTAYGTVGSHGKAILNLERTLLLDPGNEDARENLRIVRSTLARQRTAQGVDADIDPPQSFWMQVVRRVTHNQATILFLLCYVAFFIALSVRRLLKGEIVRIVLLVLIVLIGIGGLTGGTLLLSKSFFQTDLQEAIAVSSGTTHLRAGPGERFERGTSVFEGDRLRIVDRTQGWIHLRDNEGNEGWGQADDFGELRRTEQP